MCTNETDSRVKFSWKKIKGGSRWFSYRIGRYKWIRTNEKTLWNANINYLAYNFVLLGLLKNPPLTKVIIVLSFPSQLINVMPSSISLSHRNQFPVKNLYKILYKNCGCKILRVPANSKIDKAGINTGKASWKTKFSSCPRYNSAGKRKY